MIGRESVESPIMHSDRQMTPYLLNKMFSVKSTQYTKAYKKLKITSLWTYEPCRYVAASAVNRHTNTLTHTTTITLAHALINILSTNH